jgi:hypothetical protein
MLHFGDKKAAVKKFDLRRDGSATGNALMVKTVLLSAEMGSPQGTSLL